MLFLVLGAVAVLLYAGAGAWMAVVAKREPTRVFRIGTYGRTRSREVTAAQWIRRYVPWGLGLGLLLMVLGVVMVLVQPG